MSAPTPERQNIAAEQSLLGGLMLDSGAYWRVVGEVSEDDFTRREHRLIFRAIREVMRVGADPDAVTVSDWLQSSGELESAGGLAYIGSLANNTPSAANALSYARIVRDHAKQRRARTTLADALTRIEQGESLNDVIGSVFAALETDTAGDSSQDFAAMIDQAVTAAEKASDTGGRLQGISTTIPTLDRLTGGFHGSRLIILGGRPGTYKSALAWQILCKAAKRKTPCGIISLEMGAAEMGTRAIANELKLDGQGFAFGNRAIIEAAKKGVTAMRDWPLYADFASANIGRVTARLLEWRHKHGIQLAVIDHIQLTERGKGTNRHQDLSEFSRSMKQLAMRLNMPIMLVSQISREVERENRRPINADLRESGDLEQNADIILFTHKDTSNTEDRYELLLSKQRGGPANRIIDMWVDGPHFRVGEIDEARMAVAV